MSVIHAGVAMLVFQAVTYVILSGGGWDIHCGLGLCAVVCVVK